MRHEVGGKGAFDVSSRSGQRRPQADITKADLTMICGEHAHGGCRNIHARLDVSPPTFTHARDRRSTDEHMVKLTQVPDQWETSAFGIQRWTCQIESLENR